ncbi:MAG: sulfate ABC transporter, partial [Micrococcus sp.]|nr:sulfate ABC transporter [Micrococcus sp.]
MADTLVRPTRTPRPTRLALRGLVIVYLFFLVAWPVFLVGQNALAGGPGAILDLLADADVRAAFQLTVLAATVAVVINTVFGVGMSLLLVRYEFPG